ncbi:MAG: protein-disulfide reductase DsbD domain-containing protein [Planctomycetota bacterium]
MDQNRRRITPVEHRVTGARPLHPSLGVGVVLTLLSLFLGVASAGTAAGQLLGGDDELMDTTAEPTPQPEDSKVSLRVVWDASGEAWAVLSFEMPPGWHAYGPFQNGSGAAPIVDWSLPEGVAAAGTVWPVADRYVSGGIVLDHVYHETLEVATRLIGVDAGDRVEASLEWLVCDDERCVPVFGDVSAVADTTAAWSPPEDLGAFSSVAAVVSTRWDEDVLVITGFDAMQFHPAAAGSSVESPFTEAACVDGTLRIRPTWTRVDRRGPADTVAGVLVLGGEAESAAGTNPDEKVSVWLCVKRSEEPTDADAWTVGGLPAFAWGDE